MGTPRTADSLDTLTIRLKNDGTDDALKQLILRYGRGERNDALKQALTRGFALPEPQPIQVLPAHQVAAILDEQFAVVRQVIAELRRRPQGPATMDGPGPMTEQKGTTVNGASEEV